MHLFRSSVRIVLSALLTIGAASPLLHCATPTAPHSFHVAGQWKIGGEGGWGHLLLDPASHRLFIPRTDRVMIIDTETGKIAGEVSGMKSARAVALDAIGRYGYVTDLTDGTAGFVRIFDRTTLKVIASLPTGINPDAILFEPASKLIFAINTRSHSATVIDTATNQVAATIELPSRPTSAVIDGHGMIFVTLPTLGQIARIDATSRRLVASYPLGACTGPSGLAIDPMRRQLFTACEDHKLVAINVDNGEVTLVTDAPSGSGDIDADPKRNLLFIADISGTLTVLRRESPTKYRKLQQIKTEAGARTMTASRDDDKLYLVTSKYGENTANVSEELKFRPTPVPGEFSVIVVARQ